MDTRIIEQISFIKNLEKRLKNDIIFRFDSGFLVDLIYTMLNQPQPSCLINRFIDRKQRKGESRLTARPEMKRATGAEFDQTGYLINSYKSM
ncbi:hypothetical protein [Bacillus weihaiensis]|uniref:hypothetical protein n=1 Tax=Bacillus weihaiensis TaxID=1547283 RepID=UPI002355D113|nr:hypothetical protein [Bacillus weihaiensis]